MTRIQRIFGRFLGYDALGSYAIQAQKIRGDNLMPSTSFVSVVTPVYNGGKFLRECVESVLAQTHGDFEYVILDNASTDETGEIAASYAARDRRIRIHRNDHTLPIIENWNRALTLISDDSGYCKVLHADDAMYPECLSKMLALGLSNSHAGVIGSLRLRGDEVECGGLPAGTGVYPGKEVARLFLRQEIFSFAPTAGMVRSDIVRGRAPMFYPTKYLHADLAGHFEILDKTYFGLVDEVLLFSRMHEDSITSKVAVRKQTILKDWLWMLQQYGPRYFSPHELTHVERAFLRRYYRLLIRAFLTGQDRAYFEFHMEGLRAADRSPNFGDLCLAAASELGTSVTNPIKLVRYLRTQEQRTSSEGRVHL